MLAELPVDVSDIPTNASGNIRSFVSLVRDGYSTQSGTWDKWRKSIRALMQHSPVVSYLVCSGIGATMRPLWPGAPSSLIYLRGTTTTGKSIALQAVLSLRANPGDMTWCFDSMHTIKWYSVAADLNFLCLDDVHMCIMPEQGACKPLAPSYFQQMRQQYHTCNEDSFSYRTEWLLNPSMDVRPPHVGLIMTGVPELSALVGSAIPEAVEIDARQEPFWPVFDHLQPWWMDHWIQELRHHYGHARARVLESMSASPDLWRTAFFQAMDEYITKRPGHYAQALAYAQAKVGQLWLKDHADIECPSSIYLTPPAIAS